MRARDWSRAWDWRMVVRRRDDRLGWGGDRGFHVCLFYLFFFWRGGGRTGGRTKGDTHTKPGLPFGDLYFEVSPYSLIVRYMSPNTTVSHCLLDRLCRTPFFEAISNIFRLVTYSSELRIQAVHSSKHTYFNNLNWTNSVTGGLQ